jgi:hypothetical protein
MTIEQAKAKAKELVDMFIPHVRMKMGQEDYLDRAKQCAKIAVDEIIKSNPIVPLQFMLESEALDAANKYWQQVKTEIENL